MLQSINMTRLVTLLLTTLLLMVATGPVINAHPGGIFTSSDGCNCHSTTSVNAQLSGYPSTYDAEQQYVLTISMGQSAPAGGFSLEVDSGTLSNPSQDVKINSLQNSATHSSTSSTTWTVTWTAPVTGSGLVTISVAVLAANNDMQNTGDSSGKFSIQIAESSPNTPPQVTLTLPSSVDSSSDLVANISTSDSDGDSVEVSVQWLRNGFREGSLDNLLTVPAALLGPGQIWTCKVIANDGIENSLEASASATISNNPPIALIEIITEPLWIGESITVNSLMSSDSDGDVINSIWSWHDNSGNSGSASGQQSFTFIPFSQTTLTLQVVDDLGGIGLASKTINIENGPHISNISAVNNGQDVELSWQWDGPQSQFSIIRNGNIIATTNQTSFTDRPIFSGDNNYQIQPSIEGRKLLAGSDTSSIAVESSFDEIQSTHDSAALALGIIMLLSSLYVALSGLVKRGE